MDSIALRYYELRFQRMVVEMYKTYPAVDVQQYMSSIIQMSGAIETNILAAVRRILNLDPLLLIFRDEYIVAMGLTEDISKSALRKAFKCSPNTILKAFKDYEEGNLYIRPRFDIVISQDISAFMRTMDSLNKLY